MIKLTDAAVPQWVRDFPGGIRIYRAGLVAGMEHGLEHLIDSGFIGSRYAEDARAAIRALVTAERDIPLSQQAPR